VKKNSGRRRLVPVDSLLPAEAGVMRMLEPNDAANQPADGRTPMLREGQPCVLDTPEMRYLQFGLDSTQSTMRLDAPDVLVSPYTRKMMAFLLFNPNPRKILVIGLGGGSLAKFCYRHLPRTQLTVVEISADVIALRDEFQVPADDERFRVVHADGADYVRNMTVPVDVLLVDAFDEKGIAPAFAASDFYTHAAMALTANGVFVMNLYGEPSRFVSAIKGARAAFDDRLALVPVAGSGNTLLFVFKNSDPESPPKGVEARATFLERRLALEFSEFLSKLRHSHVV
jgi:spermidine synthase